MHTIKKQSISFHGDSNVPLIYRKHIQALVLLKLTVSFTQYIKAYDKTILLVLNQKLFSGKESQRENIQFSFGMKMLP